MKKLFLVIILMSVFMFPATVGATAYDMYDGYYYDSAHWSQGDNTSASAQIDDNDGNNTGGKSVVYLRHQVTGSDYDYTSRYEYLEDNKDYNKVAYNSSSLKGDTLYARGKVYSLERGRPYMFASVW